ncbi:MAG: AMP nucleosidase, partial [Actinomycetota bacterium]|nr:AMP nucleosidase [Actinomycetota bacterium]
MPAWHHHTAAGDGVSLVNIGVGPANAKTVTDHLAVLRPDTMMMIGHCGGLRNHQRLGDFVLATAYQRADHVLDEVLPADVPVIPNHRLNVFLLDALEAAEAGYRLGVVHTTDNRNWEFNQGVTLAAMRASRSIAVDMESATIAANGFRYRIPNATLLCVSDKPL